MKQPTFFLVWENLSEVPPDMDLFRCPDCNRAITINFLRQEGVLHHLSDCPSMSQEVRTQALQLQERMEKLPTEKRNEINHATLFFLLSTVLARDQAMFQKFLEHGVIVPVGRDG